MPNYGDAWTTSSAGSIGGPGLATIGAGAGLSGTHDPWDGGGPDEWFKTHRPLGIFPSHGDLWGLGGKPQSTFAADTRARLAREDYADWLRTFRPIENELIAQYDNPALRERSVAEAQQMAMQGLAGAQESLGRRNAELGISLTQGQQKSLDRQMNLAGGLALVNAANQTRRRIDDRDQQLLTGISPQGSSLRYAQGQ